MKLPRENPNTEGENTNIELHSTLNALIIPGDPRTRTSLENLTILLLDWSLEFVNFPFSGWHGPSGVGCMASRGGVWPLNHCRT